MKYVESWADFLKRTNKNPTRAVDWEGRKKEWVNSIGTLYAQIETWLTPEKNEGLITFKTDRSTLREEYLGEYEAPTLSILVGNSTVGLFPRGTLIIGSQGRIDMRGSSNQVMLIREKAGDWKFAYRDGNKVTYEEVNSDSLKNWIQQVL